MSTGDIVAVKVLRADASHELTRQFAAHGEVSDRTLHRNCVRGLDRGVEGGRAYIVMERVVGEPLSTRLGSPVPEAVVFAWLEGLLSGLEHLHLRGFVHRDIKPDNVVLRAGGRPEAAPVLVDFGSARRSASREGERALTLVGLMSGTPAYMSPEQAMGLEVDARSDLYSVGIIAHELLMGRPPFLERDPVELLQRHILDDVPSLPHVSGHVEALVLRLCGRLRRDRFESATEALASVRSVRSGKSLQQAGDTLKRSEKPRPSSKPPATAFTKGAMRVAGAIGAVVVSTLEGTVVALSGSPGVCEQALRDVHVVQAQLEVLRKLGRTGHEIREFTMTVGDTVQLIYLFGDGERVGFVFVDRRVGNLALAREGLASLAVPPQSSMAAHAARSARQPERVVGSSVTSAGGCGLRTREACRSAAGVDELRARARHEVATS